MQNMSVNLLPAPSPAQDLFAKRRRGRRLERQPLTTLRAHKFVDELLPSLSPAEGFDRLNLLDLFPECRRSQGASQWTAA